MMKLLKIAGGPQHVRTLIDVGANDGSDCLPVARANHLMSVVAVEPTPELASALESAGLPNVTVAQCAIGAVEGSATLKIRGNNLQNSLGDVETDEVSAAGISASTLGVEREVIVPVRTLEALCLELGVETIDVLHVDAQGCDLDVLRSAGPLLATVRAGVVEAANHLRLYTNSASRADVVEFLIQNGMRVVAVEAADSFNYEQNIYFAPSTRSARYRKVVAAAKGWRADLSLMRFIRRKLRPILKRGL